MKLADNQIEVALRVLNDQDSQFFHLAQVPKGEKEGRADRLPFRPGLSPMTVSDAANLRQPDAIARNIRIAVQALKRHEQTVDGAISKPAPLSRIKKTFLPRLSELCSGRPPNSILPSAVLPVNFHALSSKFRSRLRTSTGSPLASRAFGNAGSSGSASPTAVSSRTMSRAHRCQVQAGGIHRPAGHTENSSSPSVSLSSCTESSWM